MSLFASNADEPAQLEGHWITDSASFSWEYGPTVQVTKGIGAETSQGTDVWAVEGGIEAGYEATFGIGYSFTGGAGMVVDGISDLFGL